MPADLIDHATLPVSACINFSVIPYHHLNASAVVAVMGQSHILLTSACLANESTDRDSGGDDDDDNDLMTEFPNIVDATAAGLGVFVTSSSLSSSLLSRCSWFLRSRDTALFEDDEGGLLGCARHTSHVTRHTSHVTRHTSHVTRHTSHVTRHTSHVTRHTSRDVCYT